MNWHTELTYWADIWIPAGTLACWRWVQQPKQKLWWWKVRCKFAGALSFLEYLCYLLLLMQYLVLHGLQSSSQWRARLLQLLLHQEIHIKVGGCWHWRRDPASWRPDIYGHPPNGRARGFYGWRGGAGSGRSLRCLGRLRRCWCLRGVGALRRRTKWLGVGWTWDIGRGKSGRWAGLAGHERMLLDWSWGRTCALAGGNGHGVDKLGWFGSCGWGSWLGWDRWGYLLSFHCRDRETRNFN